MSVQDLSPIHQDDLAPPWVWNLVDGQGNVPNLTNVQNNQFTLYMRNRDTGVVTQGAGAFTVTQPGTLGQVVYAPASPDTAVPGGYKVWIKWQDSGGPSPRSSDEQDLVILGTF